MIVAGLMQGFVLECDRRDCVLYIEHHLFRRRLVERLVKDCGADVNSKVTWQCESYFVEALLEATAV